MKKQTIRPYSLYLHSKDQCTDLQSEAVGIVVSLCTAGLLIYSSLTQEAKSPGAAAVH